MVKQPRLFETPYNNIILNYNFKEYKKKGYTKIYFICPLTGKSFKERNSFWNHIVSLKLDPLNMTYDRQLNVENKENILKLFDKTKLEYLWFTYLKDEKNLFETVKTKDKIKLLKNFKNHTKRKILENLIGEINLELYIILLKVYKGEMDIDECLDNIKGDNISTDYNTPIVNKEINMIDLFAGTGAFSTAFEENGVKCCFANDFCKKFTKNF